jgi:hypothetical protein
MVINPVTWIRPVYNPFFQIDDIREWTEDVYDVVSSSIKTGMDEKDTSIIIQTILNSGDGDYLEIGSLFGASAIIAALTKIRYGIEGDIFCIDDIKATGKDYITDNCKKFGVSDRVHLYIEKSHPFPLYKQRFRTTLIDAGHDYQSCIQDWENAKRVTDKYIIVHDYDPEHPGVVKACREMMREWIPVLIAGHVLVLEKL